VHLGSGQRKKKKKKKEKKKLNQKNQLKKGAALSVGYGTAHPERDARRHRVVSHSRTRRGRGGCPRARGGRCRIAENTGCDTTCGKGRVGWGCEKEKKRRKIKKK
jgi:hypothetical protein